MRILLLFIITAIVSCSKGHPYSSDEPSSKPMGIFMLVRADMADPVSWVYAGQTELGCNYTSGDVCYIFCERDTFTNLPKYSALVELMSVSANFTQPYTGFYGRVRLKP